MSSRINQKTDDKSRGYPNRGETMWLGRRGREGEISGGCNEIRKKGGYQPILDLSIFTYCGLQDLIIKIGQGRDDGGKEERVNIFYGQKQKAK